MQNEKEIEDKFLKNYEELSPEYQKVVSWIIDNYQMIRLLLDDTCPSDQDLDVAEERNGCLIHTLLMFKKMLYESYGK